jgi:hypothetical protein
MFGFGSSPSPGLRRTVMTNQARYQLPALIGVFFLVGACNSDIDYSHSRAISADTAATQEEGSTSRWHARTTAGEPVGSIPWQMRDR